MALRSRVAVLLAVIEGSEGVFQSPSASTDAILVEAPDISFNPQNSQTDEVTASLDPRTPVVGGMQCQLTFRSYLKGQGVPGIGPEIDNLLKAAGFGETLTKTDYTAATISITGTNTVADSANGLALFTVGTVLTMIGSLNNAQRELLVSTSAAGSLGVTNIDGSAPALVNESAGASITLRRGVAGVAATAGTGTTFTAQSPWAATLQLYRGMPVLISGNPALAAFASIRDYTTGRVADLCDTFNPVLSTSSKVSIPANALYLPISTGIPSLSMEFYRDGVRYQFKGQRGTVAFDWTAGGTIIANWTFSGMFHAKTDTALPVPTYDATRPGAWKGSYYSINRVAAALSRFSLNGGMQLVYPPDPNASEGFTAATATARRMTGSLDPNETLIATRDLLAAFRAGTQQPICARQHGGPQAVAGNRVSIVVPAAFYESYKPGNRQGISTEETGFFADGQDAGAMLCIY